MEYALSAYLERLPTEALEKFLRDYMNAEQEEDFSDVIGEVVRELAHRKDRQEA